MSWSQGSIHSIRPFLDTREFSIKSLSHKKGPELSDLLVVRQESDGDGEERAGDVGQDEDQLTHLQPTRRSNTDLSITDKFDKFVSLTRSV